MSKIEKKKFLFTFIDLVTVPFLIGSSISHTQHHPYCTNNQQTNILANNIEISLTLSPRFASNTNTLPLCPRVSLTIGIAGHCKIQQHICSEKVLPIGQFHQPMWFFLLYVHLFLLVNVSFLSGKFYSILSPEVMLRKHYIHQN